MLNIKKQVFNAVMASLLIASPVLAAEGSTSNGAEAAPGRLVAAKKLECSGTACQRGGKLGFSDSQLEKMSSIRNQFLDKTASERGQLGSLHRELRNVLSQSQIDRSKAEGIQAKINSIKDDLSNAKLNFKIDEIATLTPEQREQFHHRMLVAESFGGKFSHHRHFERGAARQEKA